MRILRGLEVPWPRAQASSLGDQLSAGVFQNWWLVALHFRVPRRGRACLGMESPHVLLGNAACLQGVAQRSQGTPIWAISWIGGLGI